MSLATLILASFIAQQTPVSTALDSNVTFRANACGLSTLTRQLATATGTSLDADPNLERQILLVNVKDVKLSDLMARIADVSDCEWVDLKGVQHLQVAPEKRKRTYEHEVADRAKAISVVLDKYKTLAQSSYQAKDLANYVREQLRKRTTQQDNSSYMWKPEMGPDNDFMGASPGGRTFARAISSLDPNVLARMHNDERIVYSTNPTAMQKKLALDIGAEKTKWNADATAFGEAIKLAHLTPEEIDQLGYTGRSDDEEPAIQDVTNARLIVSRAELFGSSMITCELWLMGKEGYVRDSHQTQVWFGAEAFGLFVGGQNPRSDTTVPARPDSLWHRSFILAGTNRGEGGDHPMPVDPRKDTIILHPEKQEPLSYFTSDMLIACADSVKKNIVAELGDTDILLGYIAAESDTLPKVAARLESTVFENMSKEENWIEWRPNRVSEERANRIDRAALAHYLTRPASPSGTQLEAKALYSWARKSDVSMNMVEMMYQQCLARDDEFAGMWVNDDWVNPAVKLIGSLDVSSRAALFKGAKLSYGNLQEPQKAILRRLAFGVIGSRTINAFGNEWNQTGSVDESELEEAYVHQDVTDVCANGVPANATVELKFADTPQLFVPADDPKGEWVATDPENVAWAIAVQKKPALFNPQPDDPTPKPVVPKAFRMGSLRSYRLLFWVAPKVYFGYSSNEPARPASPQVYSLEQLPPEIQKRITEATKAYIEDGGGDDGGTRNP